MGERGFGLVAAHDGISEGLARATAKIEGLDLGDEREDAPGDLAGDRGERVVWRVLLREEVLHVEVRAVAGEPDDALRDEHEPGRLLVRLLIDEPAFDRDINDASRELR